MYPVNFTEKMSVNLTHAHTVCTRPTLSQREGPGDEAKSGCAISVLGLGGLGKLNLHELCLLQ